MGGEGFEGGRGRIRKQAAVCARATPCLFVNVRGGGDAPVAVAARWWREREGSGRGEGVGGGVRRGAVAIDETTHNEPREREELSGQGSSVGCGGASPPRLPARPPLPLRLCGELPRRGAPRRWARRVVADGGACPPTCPAGSRRPPRRVVASRAVLGGGVTTPPATAARRARRAGAVAGSYSELARPPSNLPTPLPAYVGP